MHHTLLQAKHVALAHKIECNIAEFHISLFCQLKQMALNAPDNVMKLIPFLFLMNQN